MFFEHVSDPVKTLAEASRILKSGGLFVASVPNPSCLEARIFGSNWVGWERPRHLYLFTPTLLQRYLTDAGFEPDGFESFNGRLNVTRLSIEFACKSRGIPEKKWRSWVNLITSLPFRVITLPIYYTAEKLNQTTVMTAFATKI